MAGLTDTETTTDNLGFLLYDLSFFIWVSTDRPHHVEILRVVFKLKRFNAY